MILLHVKVKPGAGKDELTVDSENTVHAKIRAKAIDGAANEYLVKFLAEKLGVRASAVSIEKGHTSTHKKVRVAADSTEISEKLSAFKFG